MIKDILITSLIILIIQLLFATYAIIKKTDKVTDLSYGLTFVLTTLFLLIRYNNITPVTYAITILITIWGIRLATYLFRRIRLIKKDKRFDNIRERLWKFLSFWLFQAISIFIILLPVIIVFTKTSPNNLPLLSVIGILISITGLIIESIADKQKFDFKLNTKNKNSFISTGLWKYSRHPNYFGEILFWIGISLSLFPGLQGLEYISLISPVYITTLLLFITGIPTLEKKYKERFSDDKRYIEYQKKTSVLIPWFKR